MFSGAAEGGPSITVDSSGAAGPSPTQLLLLSLAGCMGVDIRLILEKSRVPVRAIEVTIEGDRAASEPRKFEALRLVCRVDGPVAEDQKKMDRALQLSRDKYCSVLHTLRSDLELDMRIERA